MSWLKRLFQQLPRLSDDQIMALTAYRDLPGPAGTRPINGMRFVVLDVESSGLNPYRDRLLSIGAVSVTNGLIRIGDAFEVIVRQDAPSDDQNILVHGIDGTTQLAGRDPREAFLAFIAYAARAPLVGYHVDFDRVMIERGMSRTLAMKPLNDWLDVGRMLSALFPGHAAKGRGLDYWLGVFSIPNFARHAALADALATAQLLQVALARGAARGLGRYSELRRIDDDQRWLEHARDGAR